MALFDKINTDNEIQDLDDLDLAIKQGLGHPVQAQLVASKKKVPHESEQEGQLTVDVYQNEDEIIVKSTIAGVSSEDIDILITNDMITIKGNREIEEKIKKDDFFYQEIYWGNFSRSIILPEDIDADKAKASMKNGVLTIRLPKLAKSRVKKIKID